LGDGFEGQPTVGFEGYTVWRDSEGAEGTSHASGQGDAELWALLAEKDPEKPALFVDGRDYSVEYAKCLESSDYTRPTWSVASVEELKSKQETADVSNEWAACARENGFANVRDAEMTAADGFATVPTAILPASTTIEELKVLLTKCPNADADGPAKYVTGGDRIGDTGGGVVLDGEGEEAPSPNIGLDLPGCDGKSIRSEIPAATVQRCDEFRRVLWESMIEITEDTKD
jgi:hypothetical protein